MKHLEIERKFLIHQIPSNLYKFPKYQILQWYFSNFKSKNSRLRKQWNQYFLTHKSWSWLVRKEKEKEITKSEFNSLRKSVWKIYLNKIRYDIPYKKYLIQLDIYQWKLTWLISVEIEFPNINQSQSFPIPKRFGIELTQFSRAKNSYLAKNWICLKLKKLISSKS